MVMLCWIILAYFFFAHCPTEGPLTVRSVLAWAAFVVLAILLLRHGGGAALVGG